MSLPPSGRRPGATGRWRLAIAVLLVAVALGPVAWMWYHSLAPADFSATGAPADLGNGTITSAMPVHDHGSGPSAGVADLVDRTRRTADVTFDLTARQEPLTVGGSRLEGYTLNGTSPGPQLTVYQGQLVQVHLHNASVTKGVTLHWHGIDVPNAMDGVAGVTQDAVRVGGEFTYRFVADHPGTFWYHSHQLSSVQVPGGLFGAVVVLPRRPLPERVDVTALAHTYAGIRTLNGRAGDLHVPARPGQLVRVRVINTDSGSVLAWSGVPTTLVALDGRDIHGPAPFTGRSVLVTAGGRADLRVAAPTDGSAVRIQVGKATAVVIGGNGQDASVPAQPAEQLDLLAYGTRAPLGFDPTTPDRRFSYVIGRRPGFVLGRPGMWWSINGRLYPNIPMAVVATGDVVEMHLDNRSNEPHPIHLHGHHAVVLARNGIPATGAPWWFDSLEVPLGTSYDIAFVADNPGVWMDHCHNLKHAADGMVMHFMYEGVTDPYRIGGSTGNHPE